MKDNRANESEVRVWAALAAKFHKLNGRDPTDHEHEVLLAYACKLVASDQCILH
jgi:hypothetical protein